MKIHIGDEERELSDWFPECVLATPAPNTISMIPKAGKIFNWASLSSVGHLWKYVQAPKILSIILTSSEATDKIIINFEGTYEAGDQKAN